MALLLFGILAPMPIISLFSITMYVWCIMILGMIALVGWVNQGRVKLDKRYDRAFATVIATWLISYLILSYTAQKERENIHKRQEMGIAAAQSKGVKFGRPKAQYPAEWKVTYKAWKDGQITATAAMEKMGIKRTTFYKLVKRYEQKED